MISPFFALNPIVFRLETLLAGSAFWDGPVLWLCALPRSRPLTDDISLLRLVCATLALGNAFRCILADPDRFPAREKRAAVGWIAGGVRGLLRGEQSSIQFYLAARLSAARAFSPPGLPTPPQKVCAGELVEVRASIARGSKKRPSRSSWRALPHLHPALFLLV